LANISDLARLLDLKVVCRDAVTNGWIVDTSIEHDHELFSGHLKVSLEEVLIALRDDHGLLNDPAQLLGNTIGLGAHRESYDIAPQVTLYADGFNFSRFIEVVESEAVWNECLAIGIPGLTTVRLSQHPGDRHSAGPRTLLFLLFLLL